ncbi:MAG: hypothetical protein HRT87_05045 [Legionellales bacterium]|nr:hypothetical protein [Legionellales bacterium]
MNHSRSELINHYIQQKEYRIMPVGLRRHLRKSKLSSGARICFDLLYDEATFSSDWSTRISRQQIANELGTAEKPKNINTVTRLLAELERGKYIIRSCNIGETSTIYINFPEDVINDIEATPDRKKVEAIKKCGTVVDSNSTQKCVAPLHKNDDSTLYNNIYKNNNRGLDTDKVKSCASSKEKSVVVNSFFMDEDSSQSSVDTIEQENNLVERISSLEKDIQSLYNQTKGKSSEDILKIYRDIDKLTPQKHELERQLAVLKQKSKPKKNNISDSLQKFTVKQLETIKDCCLYESSNDEAQAKKYVSGLMQQVLTGSLDTVSYKTGKRMTIEHRLNIAKGKIYSKDENFDFGIN